jgi:hypothetical protein
MLFLHNPELRRLAWLELTPTRLIALPLVLGLALALALVNRAPHAGIAAGAMSLFLLLTHFWGMRQAANALSDEFRDRTWDWQRLSVASPAGLALGKLAGSNLFTWYGGAMCLATYAYFMRADTGLRTIAWSGLLACASALMLQSASMFLSLLAPGTRHARLPLLLLLVVMALPALGSLYPLLTDGHGRVLRWYGVALPMLPFAALSALVFAAWAVTGVVRLMAAELQVRTLPVVWCGFLMFVAVYGGGFVIGRGTAIPTATMFLLLIASLACSAGGYGAALLEGRDPLRFRRMGLAWRAGRMRRVIEELPNWGSAMALALALALGLMAVMAAAGLHASLRSGGEVSFDWFDQGGTFGPMTPLALGLLALRDIAVIQGAGFTRGGKRSDLAIALWLLLAYLLLPAFLSAFDARDFLLPNPLTDAARAALTFGIQGALALVWALARWRRLANASV